IASLTKPITAVAALMLVEECALRLDDPVDDLLPEWAGRGVLNGVDTELGDTVPAERPVTLRDLLVFTAGIGVVMAMPGTYPIQARIRDLQIGGDGPPLPALAPATDEWLRRLGSLPWMAHPGERWMYQVSIDVLGALVSRVAGQPLGAFMRERIFDPLGMKDTAFHVPADKRGRFPACYVFDAGAGALRLYDGIEDSTWGTPPPMESGGGGLVSTVDDYFAFCRMMLNGGSDGAERILSPASVSLMTADHVTPAERAGMEVFFGTHSSWGFGMAVDLRREEIYQSPGRFGWTGGLGTTAYTDPANGVIGILLTQRLMGSPQQPRVFTDFWTTAYGAME
ncbi:MAG: beta-lactamase family protein, partial [Gemmatimonadetes bacterium]|nr:beta-lactamase family protein [Gemmatimonadota bacterium]